VDDFLILLNEHTAVAASGVQAVGELVALDVVLLAKFAALDELKTV
jgi:hypothetical protein